MPEAQLPTYMISDSILTRLKKQRAKVEELKASIEAEMSEKGLAMQLWTNGQCKDWSNYVQAQNELSAMRDQYKV